jgi:hypothetical protein
VSKQTLASDATVTSVSASATAVTLLAANFRRTGASFYNQSTSVCYLKLGAAATATDFTVRMTANALYELGEPVWLGIITAIWDSATGAMRITEFT